MDRQNWAICLVKKNVLNEINKEWAFTQGFKDSWKIKKKSISKFIPPSDKVSYLTVNAKPAQTVRESVATLWGRK